MLVIKIENYRPLKYVSVTEYRKMSMTNDELKMLISKILTSDSVSLPVVVPDVVEVPEKKIAIVEKPKRCEHTNCKTKLMLSDFACKCSKFYCISHKHAEIHSCSYDFKARGNEILEKQLVKAVASKVDKI
jgi:hypothetical protein